MFLEAGFLKYTDKTKKYSEMKGGKDEQRARSSLSLSLLQFAVVYYQQAA